MTSKFGSFGISESMDQRVLALSGTTTEINEKLNNLRYKNQMFDTRKYTDLVTLWIKGFPTLHFEIQIKRQQLDVLQVKLLNAFKIFHMGSLVMALMILVITPSRYGLGLK